MDIKEPFRFAAAYYFGDKFMVGATLASMRHYCPDVPICLIADGDVEVSDLEKEYDLIVYVLMTPIIFACKRNVIPYERYREIESWGKITWEFLRGVILGC